MTPGSGVEDHPSDKAGMTCISEGDAKSKFCSPSPASQGRERRDAVGAVGHSQWGGEHQGWGKERDPGSPIPSPQVLGCYFLTREPAIPVQPPSRAARPSIRPSFPRQPAASSRFSSSTKPASQPSPASAFLQPHVPIATSDLDVGCLVKAGRGK